MSHLIYYRDNILSKIKENQELEKLQNWIRDFYGDEIKISFGLFSPKLKISKFTLSMLIEKQIKYNEEMIDKYLSLSFVKGKEASNGAIEKRT